MAVFSGVRKVLTFRTRQFLDDHSLECLNLLFKKSVRKDIVKLISSEPATLRTRKEKAMKFGYMRVSTAKQADNYSFENQKERLLSAGVEEANIFQDVGSGSNQDRNGFKDMLSRLRSGDEVVVVKLDRFGRSMKDLVDTLEDFSNLGINLRSLNDGLDSSTPMGRGMIMMAGVFAEVERNYIYERTNDGIAKARRNGVKFGRPTKRDNSLVERAKRLKHHDGLTSKEAAAVLGVSRSHYYELLKL